MSRADHDQHRRDIDGIHTDMALLDEDLNNRIDALESTINTRFDDINDLGENTDHEVELLKARVSALESIRTQDDTIQNQDAPRLSADFLAREMKIGDRVQNLSGTHRGLIVDYDRHEEYPFKVQDDATHEVDYFTASELRHADTDAPAGYESARDVYVGDVDMLDYDKGGALPTILGTSTNTTGKPISVRTSDSTPTQEAQSMAWVDLEQESTYRKIAESRVKELEECSDSLMLDLAEAMTRADAWSSVARGLARRCADFRYHDKGHDQYVEKLIQEYGDKEAELMWWTNGAQASEADALRERDEARETAFDLAVALELAQSRAASERRIDPAAKPRPYNDGLRFNDA